MNAISRRKFIAAGAASLAAMGASPGPETDDDFIVHEWGVVTIPYGSSRISARSAGVRKGKNAEEISETPPFVVTWGAAVKKQIEDLNRMQFRKPVVYFYSKKEMALSVKVSVPTGRPEAWWPPADDFAPKSTYVTPGKLGGRPQKAEEIAPENGHLLWRRLTLDPGAGGFRKVEGWWETARKTDSTPIRAGNESEKFLFYDALAHYDPGLEIRWKKGGRVQIRNGSSETVRHLFAIRVKDGQAASAYRKELAANETAELAVEKGKPRNLADVLIAAGLYPREAEGLAAVWDEEWFGFDGVRILTMVSRAAYDRLLPLEIAPAPKELSRVLLAHVECLDAEATDAVAALAEDLGSDDLQKRDAASAQLRARMPLAAGAIREALAKAKDPEVRGRLEDLLRAAAPANK